MRVRFFLSKIEKTGNMHQGMYAIAARNKDRRLGASAYRSAAPTANRSTAAVQAIQPVKRYQRMKHPPVEAIKTGNHWGLGGAAIYVYPR